MENPEKLSSEMKSTEQERNEGVLSGDMVGWEQIMLESIGEQELVHKGQSSLRQWLSTCGSRPLGLLIRYYIICGS